MVEASGLETHHAESVALVRIQLPPRRRKTAVEFPERVGSERMTGYAISGSQGYLPRIAHRTRLWPL